MPKVSPCQEITECTNGLVQTQTVQKSGRPELTTFGGKSTEWSQLEMFAPELESFKKKTLNAQVL
jgi:hypothetical protein